MPLFKVIRASAGSGKTFNLTHEYLRLLFKDSEAFMHILAVTFTNKATEEMKSRIVRELFALASGNPSKQLLGLMNDTGLNEKQIQGKATIILKKLLHRYSGFNVTTIDAFFQRIIRSFTRELGIQEGYSIELDTEMVLSEVIDRLLLQAENDNDLLVWLTQFAESLIEKGESWNLRKGMHELGKEIFREEFKSLNTPALQKFSDRRYLIDYKGNLQAIVRKTENTIRNFGTQAIAILESYRLTVDDFSNKYRGPAGFLVSLARDSFRMPNITAINAAQSADKWYTSSSPRKNEITQAVSNELMPLMQKVIHFTTQNEISYFTAQVILKHLYTLGILFDLLKLSDTWCSDNNVFLLTEAPAFLNKIIDGNDTPFIYEKAGCWFHHFMIDEFQDTSMLQWLNFKPLISNSLSQNFDNLAVGDTKQSIYRWRNSNWEILETRINEDFLPGIVEPLTLKENWRSGTSIISFNNHFFSHAANVLQTAFNELTNNFGAVDGIRPITELYRDMEQTPGDREKSSGYVQMDYLSNGMDISYDEVAGIRVIEVIDEILALGYHLNDIAILTRKKKEASFLAEYLLKYSNTLPEGKKRLDVISDEALMLGNSIIVNMVVSCLRYLNEPGDLTNNYYIQALCSNYLFPNSEAWTNSISGDAFPDEFKQLVQSYESLTLTEITERIIKIYRLENHKGELVYLLAFRDMVIEYARHYGSDLTGFLQYWEETGSEKPVSAPAAQDAIRILTLHKSKGLEFKITIIPFCSWELVTYNKSFLWCRPDKVPFNALPVLPLTFNTQLEHTIFAGDFYREVYMQYVDNLNLLYVAFTRARDAMYIFCKGRKDEQLKNVSDLAGRVVGQSIFTSGELLRNEQVESGTFAEELTTEVTSMINLTDRLKIAYQGRLFIDPLVNKPSRPINEGKILHEIFTFIRKRSDIVPAVNRLYLQGRITAEERNKYIKFIEHAMNDIQVSAWFTDDWEIMNEAEIILPREGSKRPDRVLIREDHTVVIDFKFGNRMEIEYEVQLKEYALLLREMGYAHVEAFIWYVKLERVAEVKQ